MRNLHTAKARGNIVNNAYDADVAFVLEKNKSKKVTILKDFDVFAVINDDELIGVIGCPCIIHAKYN